MFDKQPVVALSFVSIRAHPHQNPASPQSFSLERKFQVAAPKRLLWRLCAFGLPIAAVPQLNSAAAILALRNRAFEIPIVEGMILNFHRQPLVMRIERRA